MSWDASEALLRERHVATGTSWEAIRLERRRRRPVAAGMSRQAHRIYRQLPAILAGATGWLGDARAAEAVWQLAAKQSEFGHLVVGAYREGRYSPIAALARSLYEDATLLGWCAAPDDSEEQASRALRALLDHYRRVRRKGRTLPPETERMLNQAGGKSARKPPSIEHRAGQLDDHERGKQDGSPFWVTHLGHVETLTAYVDAALGGAPHLVDPMTRELVGFGALVYGHQYLSLSIVSIDRLSNRNSPRCRARDAFARIHDQDLEELERLVQ